MARLLKRVNFRLVVCIISGLIGMLIFSLGMHPIFEGREISVNGGILVLIGLLGVALSVKVLIRLIDNSHRNTDIKSQKGARIVTIGGGTGLATMLRGLKYYTDNLTAIVTVADDGGSSGRIRDDMDILPPGDIRNCITAMADAEEGMKELLEYRFTRGILKDQSFGNFFLVAMAEIHGSFELGVKRMSNVLAVRGKVLPVTLDNVRLIATLENGCKVLGESNIPKVSIKEYSKISKIELDNPNAEPNMEAIKEIMEADIIVIGPGSLYTSLIPNFLVKGIGQAISKSKGKVIYISNLMTQPGETGGYNLLDHVRVLEEMLGSRAIDYVIVNKQEFPREVLDRYLADGAEPIYPMTKKLNEKGYKVLELDLVDLRNGYLRHDTNTLTKGILQIYRSYKNIARG